MRLATRHNGTRDGELVVVDRSGERFASARWIAPTLQAALDNWDALEPQLLLLAERLETGSVAGHALTLTDLQAPLPRAYEWVDGSAYINHIILVRQARGAKPPDS